MCFCVESAIERYSFASSQISHLYSPLYIISTIIWCFSPHGDGKVGRHTILLPGLWNVCVCSPANLSRKDDFGERVMYDELAIRLEVLELHVIYLHLIIFILDERPISDYDD